MNNKDKILKALAGVSDNLNNEIQYYLDVYSILDADYTAIDALNDAYDLAVDNNDRSIINEVHTIYINCGFVVPVDITKVISTGKKYYFRRNSIYYDCVYSWEQFILL